MAGEQLHLSRLFARGEGGGVALSSEIPLFVLFSQSLHLLSMKDDGLVTRPVHFLVILGSQHRSPNNNNKK